MGSREAEQKGPDTRLKESNGNCPGWKTWKSQRVGKDISISSNRKNSSMSHMKTKGVLLVTGSKTFSTRNIKKSLAETG